jgi:hypothetical protein
VEAVVRYTAFYLGKQKMKFGFEFSKAGPAHTSDEDTLKRR